MDEEKLSPEIEKMLNQIRLKQPSKELMTDYLAGINARIDQKLEQPHFGFPQGMMIVAVGLVLAGIFYWMHVRPTVPRESVMEMKVPPVSLIEQNPTVASHVLSLEEEMTVLEAFEESPRDVSDWLDDEEPVDDLTLLDDLELSGANTPTPGV